MDEGEGRIMGEGEGMNYGSIWLELLSIRKEYSLREEELNICRAGESKEGEEKLISLDSKMLNK